MKGVEVNMTVDHVHDFLATTFLGRIVWWSFVLLNFTYSSLCMYLQRKKKRKKKNNKNKTLLCFYWKGSQDCIPAPELWFKYVYPSLVFCIKRNHKEKEPFIVQHVGIVSPLLFFSFLEYIKQLILLYLLFSFVNFLVLFKNGFIKGLL